MRTPHRLLLPAQPEYGTPPSECVGSTDEQARHHHPTGNSSSSVARYAECADKDCHDRFNNDRQRPLNEAVEETHGNAQSSSQSISSCFCQCRPSTAVLEMRRLVCRNVYANPTRHIFSHHPRRDIWKRPIQEMSTTTKRPMCLCCSLTTHVPLQNTALRDKVGIPASASPAIGPLAFRLPKVRAAGSASSPPPHGSRCCCCCERTKGLSLNQPHARLPPTPPPSSCEPFCSCSSTAERAICFA